MANSTEIKKCCCHVAQQETAAVKQVPKAGKTVRSALSVLLSVLIAFFPKCPVCWAVYMSMFSCLGIAKLPYMGWLLPILIGLLGIHMLMLYRKARKIGYLPFFISLAGAALILFSKAFFPLEKWLLFTGMSCIICGSLMNSFAGNRLQLFLNKKISTPQY